MPEGTSRTLKFLMWVTGILTPVVVLIGVGLINMNSNIAVAQANDKTNEKEHARYEKAIALVPEIAARLKEMDKTQQESNLIHREFLEYMKADAVDDAKSHHSHRGRDGQ